MRILDLFCGAGGAAMGYHRAGFQVVGVDIAPQPRYPFKFLQGDALHSLRSLLASSRCPRHGLWGYYTLGDFDGIHASPPCQSHTNMSNRYRGQGGVADSHISLIADTRELLQRTGLPYVLENVPGARKHLHDPVTIAGGAFSLHVDRPRLFEANWPLQQPKYVRPEHIIGVYGVHPDGRLLWRRKDGSELRAAKGVEQARRAMGIDWMEWRELCEAIPPDYTELIGSQLMQHIRARVAA